MRPTRILPILLAALMAAPIALAEDAPSTDKKCPPVYGTWRTTHVADRFGNFEELDPPKGRRRELMEARIDEHKAVLIWNGKRQPVTEGRKRRTFKRVYRYEQTPNYFEGIDQDRQYIEIHANFYMKTPYPDDKCYLLIGAFPKIDSIEYFLTHALMLSVK
ncbi:hypothetical protein A6A04_01780 [Paramagnetospirillum marisnigri]|uniref:Uncharacterized protein n=1 Tax=Paramagnetospirillum marisnigri TaxID=1285242 RepID=A0A178MNB2_9PROT|nr:hypothetical protein [Paramagnetospirillum marisnigri]OAN50166.1 hypothetical protein A6A04_01780 [Paramagnetospirillum marisnigri]